MKQHINEVKSQINPAFGNKTHIKQEFLKYKIWKFSIDSQKSKQRDMKDYHISKLNEKSWNKILAIMKQKNSIMLTEAKLMKSMTK